MADYAATAQFRTGLNSELLKGGYLGGYQFFLGRYPTWDEFVRALRSELEIEGCMFLEFELKLDISCRDDLNIGEQQELFDNLPEYPLQFRTRHLYRSDDA